MISEQNKKTKNLNDLEKKKINNLLSNRITSLRKKQVNKIPYRQNNPNNFLIALLLLVLSHDQNSLINL